MEAGLYQIFSCIGTGKVQFGLGAVAKVQVKWFGAKGDNGTDDYAAITQALKSLPPFGDGTLYNWSGELMRSGVVHLSPGQYRTSSTIMFGMGTTLEGDGVYHTSLGFSDGAAASTEKFVLMVDRRATLGSYFTHNVYLRDIAITGVSTTNAFSSGVQWYGAENNGLRNVYVGDCSKRGLVIGGDDFSGATKCDKTNLSNIWVNSITEGPGLSINCWTLSGDTVSVDHINDADNAAIAGVQIVASNDVYISALGMENPGRVAVLSTTVPISTSGLCQQLIPLRMPVQSVPH